MSSRLKPSSSPWTKLVVLCGVLVAGLGISVLIGWHARNIALTQVRPQFVAMQYLTAVGLGFGGAGLIAFALRLPRILTIFFGGLMGMFGLLLGLEYLTGAHLGFDFLLSSFPAFPGETALRPAPPTALCFLLGGVGVVLIGANPPRFRRPAIWLLASLTLALCLMALCGYATGLAGTYT